MGLNKLSTSDVALAKSDNTNLTDLLQHHFPAYLPSNSITALAKDNAESIRIGIGRSLVRFTGGMQHGKKNRKGIDYF